MKLIGHILALLLASALSATVVLWGLGLTLGNAGYLEQTADQTHLYDNIAAATPGVSAADIKSQVHQVLPQFINFIVKAGPAPSIDFGSGPVQLGAADPRLSTAMHTLSLLGTFAPLAVVVLVLLIIALTGRRRLAILAHSAFESAIGLGLSAGVLWLAPSFILSTLTGTAVPALKAPLLPFITALLHGLATHIGEAALILLAISILLRLVHGATRLRARFAREPKKSAPPPLPPTPSSGRPSS